MRKGMKSVKKRKTRLLAIILVLLLVVTLLLPPLITMVSASERVSGVSADSASEEEAVTRTETNIEPDSSLTCLDGVYIENIDVSGMTLAEVKAAIEQKLQSLSDDSITLYAGDEKTYTVKAGDLGLTCTDDELAARAVSIGRTGNIVRRYLADSYLKKNGRIVLPMTIAATESAVKSALERCAEEINSDPIEPELQLTDEETVTAVDKVDGLTVDVDASTTIVSNYIASEWNGGEGGVRLKVDTIPASGDVSRFDGITDVLGLYKTTFDPSNTGRTTNIRRAAELINGTMLQPGEEFNFSTVVGKTTAENGFELAGSYENGAVVDTYGGGICQVSTTLYNAVLRSEIEVTERYPHSITVRYVDPSLDAAIADGSKNFRFVNSTDHAIYIYARTGSQTITFGIFGKETRDPARTIKFESRTVSTTEHTSKIKLDSSKSYGTITASGGHDGLEAQAWKLIYQNGTKQSEEQVNSSSYAMSPLTYTVGTKGASEEQLIALQSAASQNDIQTIRSLVW